MKLLSVVFGTAMAQINNPYGWAGPQVAVTGDDWQYQENFGLTGLTSLGGVLFDTLAEALQSCKDLGAHDCGGVIHAPGFINSQGQNGAYQLRRNNDGFVASVGFEEAWRYRYCEDGSTAFLVDGVTKCFIDEGEQTADQGVSTCELANARLPSPTNANEVSGLESVAVEFGYGSVLIEGSDDVTEDTWVTSAGDAMPYELWASNQPDNSSGNDDCVMIVLEFNGGMNDFPCTNTHKIICEQCPRGWVFQKVGGVHKCFKNTGQHELGQGTAVCAAEGGKMITPANQNEVSELVAVANNLGQVNVFGLDASDDALEGTWTVSNGAPFPFAPYTHPWGNAQPDNNGPGGIAENCVTLRGADQIFNDFPCGGTSFIICELSPLVQYVPPPPPTTCLNDAWELDADGNCQPKPTHFRLTCGTSGMEVSIDDAVFPDGQGVTLLDSTCTGTQDANGVWTINTALDGCQTSMALVTNDDGSESLAFTNKVKFNSFSDNAAIYTQNLVFIDFTCNYDTSYQDIEVTDVTVVSENVDADSQDVTGQFGFSLKQYTDSSLTTEADANYQTPLGGTIYLQLLMDTPVSGLDMVVTECVVYDDVLNLNYNIITAQCPDTNLQVSTSDVFTPDNLVSGINVSYLGFKFTDSVDNQQANMRISCSVTVCDENDASSTCSTNPTCA